MSVNKCLFKLFAVLTTFFMTWILYNTIPAGKRPILKYLLVESTNKNLNIGLPVITTVPGGIGNQLFEFACAYATARKRNSDTYVLKPADYVLSGNRIFSATTRHFSLDHFNITFSRSVDEDFMSYGAIFDFNEHNIWEHSLPTDKVLRLDDVCVSEIYFKDYRDEIKEMFALNIDENPIKEMLARVDNTESVSVHVRRGDYMCSADNRTMPITFQKKAMKMMRRFFPNATFFIFSDDTHFVRKELEHEHKNVIFVDNSLEPTASLLDFLLMSRCKHNIIANSTFSWWAAYLNRNKEKIVIAPMPRHPPGWNEWFYKDKVIRKYREIVLTHYLYPTEWLTLNPFEY